MNKSAIAALVTLSLAHAQSFEVASIKPSANKENGNFSEIAPGGRRFTATNASLNLLIVTAYDVSVRHISGGPGWMNSEFYDIQAETDRSASAGQIHLMLRHLLADRFKLALHRETKELPLYVLTVENRGSKLHENKSGDEPRVKRVTVGRFVFEGVPLAQLTWFLSLRLGRDVLDQTGLKGNYDFELAWTPDVQSRQDREEGALPPDPNGPSISTALREQLGLKLAATKGPVEILVIDHAERPSAN